MYISYVNGQPRAAQAPAQPRTPIKQPVRLQRHGSKQLLDVRAGFEPGDMLRLREPIEHLPAGLVLPVLGFRLLRDENGAVVSVTAYVPGRRITSVAREHVRYPESLAEEVILTALPLTIDEIEVDVYAECLRLDRAQAAALVTMMVVHDTPAPAVVTSYLRAA